MKRYLVLIASPFVAILGGLILAVVAFAMGVQGIMCEQWDEFHRSRR